MRKSLPHQSGGKGRQKREKKVKIKKAEQSDFDTAFSYIQRLWDYNTYSREEVWKLYCEVLEDKNSFFFFAVDEEGMYHGFCHGDYFNTFWMAGLTCYVSSLMTEEEDRGKGYGKFLLGYAEKLARERGCKAMILDSGLARKQAHGFYEHYGFEKSCYGFERLLK